MPVEATYGVFYEHPKLDGQHFYDTEEKRYNDVVMVEIFIKGSITNSISKEVYDADGNPAVDSNGVTFIEKYPRAWAAYKRNEGSELDGTPLKNMGGIGVSQVMNLNAEGIETVEDLAGLLDNVVIGEPGMLDLRKKAQAYIAAMDPEKLAAEQKAKDDEIAEMKKEMSEMKKALDNQVIPHKKKPRGRPRASA